MHVFDKGLQKEHTIWPNCIKIKPSTNYPIQITKSRNHSKGRATAKSKSTSKKMDLHRSKNMEHDK
jgi:hypothetical protein